MIEALFLYLFWTSVDGDYLNDYLTHLPYIVRPTAQIIGQIIAVFFGR